MYLRDESAQTILHAATLRQKLQIKLSTSPSHSIVTLGQPVPALTLYCQAPGRVATGVPNFEVTQQDLNPGSSALKVDALTTGPLRLWYVGAWCVHLYISER